MPLHDWSDANGWEGMQLLWIAELLRYLKARLPAGYRAYLGSGPGVAIGAPSLRPDVGVREHAESSVESPAVSRAVSEPDIEVAVAALDPVPALFVERDGRLVGAVELVFPRNKDRAVARTTYARRYAGYLIEGVHLLLVDVHRRPIGFSFANTISADLQMEREAPLPPPLAASYRVGEPAASGGRLLAIWKRPLRVGEALPNLPLPLNTELAIDLDLEATYMRAAADAYMT
jgi:hypothetical protein